MGRAVRIVLIAVGALLGLAVVAIAAVALLVDPNDYRDRIAGAVRAATGRELTLGGPLKLDLWPCCSLALKDASLGNPAGFPAGPFVAVDEASLGLRLWPLVTERRLEVGRIRLVGLSAELSTRADGQSNWTFDDAVDATAPDAAASGPPLGLALDGIEVKDGALTWRDARDGSDYAVSGLDIETGAVRAGSAFPLRVALALEDRQDGSAATVSLTGEATLDNDASRLVLKGFAGTVALKGPDLPAPQSTLELAADSLTLDYAGDPVLALVELTGNVDAPAGKDTPAVKGEFGAMNAVLRSGAKTRVELPALRTLLTLTGQDLPGGEARVEAELQGLVVTTEPVAGRFDALRGSVATAGADIKVTGRGAFGETTDVAGDFTLAKMSARELLQAFDSAPAATADPKALTAIAGTGRYRYTDDAVSLSDLVLTLDDTRITGQVTQTQAAPKTGAAGRTRFDLRLDRLDVDRYLAPEPDAATGGEGGAAAEPTAIPRDTLRDLTLDGRLQAGALTWEGVELAGVDLRVAAAGGRVRLDPLSAKLYGGSLTAAFGIDASGDTARVTARQQFRDVQLGPLLADFADVRSIEGRMRSELDLSAVGNTDQALERALAGRVSLSLADGVYRGTDLWYEIRRARALIRRQVPPARTGEAVTKLETLELDGPVREGVLRAERFEAGIPFLRLTGPLTLDVPAESIDGELEAKVIAAPTFEDGTSLPDLTGARLPLKLSGPLSSPKVRVDLAKMVRGAAEGVVRDKLKDVLNKGLGRLGLGGAPADPTADAPADGAGGSGETAEPAADPAAPPPRKESSGDRLRNALDKLLKPE